MAPSTCQRADGVQREALTAGAFDRENVPEDLLRRKKKKENIKAGISLKSLKQETRSENMVSLGSDRERGGGKMDVWSRDRGRMPGMLGVCLAKGNAGSNCRRR